MSGGRQNSSRIPYLANTVVTTKLHLKFHGILTEDWLQKVKCSSTSGLYYTKTSPQLSVVVSFSTEDTDSKGMASTSKQPAPARTYSNLPPVMTLRGHKDDVRLMAYFPDGKQMISGSHDKTARRWDLQARKEIEDMRNVFEQEINSVAVSRDGRWVITGSGDEDHGELKACDVETGIVKIFEGHLEGIALACMDVSEDGTLLASGSGDSTSRIWSLDSGELVAGPFESAEWLGAVRLSQDSKKLAVKSMYGKCLEVWDIQTQKLDGREWKRHSSTIMTSAPVFWTNKGTILASFTFTNSRPPKTIYEFDASTLETVGSAFEGHTEVINGLAFSSNGAQALLASASSDNTIKLWAFESRQLLASFRVANPDILVFSPDTRQVAYTKKNSDHKIYICNTPPNILFSIGLPPDPLATVRYIYHSCPNCLYLTFTGDCSTIATATRTC